MSILITICARGGSKGIPGKNIRAINGRPLIALTIDVANKFKDKFEDVDIILSTDSEQIIRISADHGLKSDYKRPDSLAGDSVGKIAAITDVLFFCEKHKSIQYDYVLDLDVTSPLRNLQDLSEAFELLRSDANAENIFSVSPANRSPYFNMVEKQEDGYYSQIKKLKSTILTRQSAPVVYDMNASFYFYRRSFFEKSYSGAITDRSLIYLVPHICFDLDYPIDFEFMSYLIQNNKLDFTL